MIRSGNSSIPKLAHQKKETWFEARRKIQFECLNIGSTSKKYLMLNLICKSLVWIRDE